MSNESRVRVAHESFLVISTREKSRLTEYELNFVWFTQLNNSDNTGVQLSSALSFKNINFIEFYIAYLSRKTGSVSLIHVNRLDNFFLLNTQS